MASKDKAAIEFFKQARAISEPLLNAGKNPALLQAEAAFKASWTSPDVKRFRAARESIALGSLQQAVEQQAQEEQRQRNSSGGGYWPEQPTQQQQDDEGDALKVFPE